MFAEPRTKIYDNVYTKNTGGGIQMVDLKFCLRFRKEIRRFSNCDAIEQKTQQGNAAESNGIQTKQQDGHHRLCEATAQLAECLTYSLAGTL